VLSADDRLTIRPHRVLVAGASGSGKTTLAAAVAAELQVRRVEIDALFHGPGWTPRPDFEQEVAAFAAGPAWVTEWQYDQVRERLADRADLLVWLDLPRPVVMRHVTVRTLRRRWGRTELWNGNQEPPLRTVLTDPEHILRWAWSTHAGSRRRVLELEHRRPGLVIVRLGSHRQARRWIVGPLHDTVAPHAGG